MFARINFRHSFSQTQKRRNKPNILKDNRLQEIKKLHKSLNKYRADFGLLRITLKNVEDATANLEYKKGKIDLFESDVDIARKIIQLFPERANARGLQAKAYQHLIEKPAKEKTLNIFAKAMQAIDLKRDFVATTIKDEELSFTIKNYSIEAAKIGDTIVMTCDCPVRRSRQICKHQLALLSHNLIFQTAAKAKRVYVTDHLTSHNLADVQTLRSWLIGSTLGEMLKGLEALEQQKKRDKDPKPAKKQRITMYFELGGE